jgi:hypothetical protein
MNIPIPCLFALVGSGRESSFFELTVRFTGCGCGSSPPHRALESRDSLTEISRDPALRTKPLPPQPTEALDSALFASRLSQLCSSINQLRATP